jgi:hypothetical protein
MLLAIYHVIAYLFPMFCLVMFVKGFFKMLHWMENYGERKDREHSYLAYSNAVNRLEGGINAHSSQNGRVH